jgi:hypothetical protein
MLLIFHPCCSFVFKRQTEGERERRNMASEVHVSWPSLDPYGMGTLNQLNTKTGANRVSP